MRYAVTLTIHINPFMAPIVRAMMTQKDKLIERAAVEIQSRLPPGVRIESIGIDELKAGEAPAKVE